MNILERILEIQRTYEAEMSAIDVKDLETCTYQELKDFNSVMRKIESNPISPAIYKITERKRLEAYPILSDVRYYPELNEMTFLSRAQLKSLDEALAMRSGRNNVFELRYKDYPNEELRECVYRFLIEKGILEKNIYLRCECMMGGRISTSFPEKYKEQWIADLKESNELMEEVKMLLTYKYSGYCHECENEEETYLGDLPETFFEDMQFGGFYQVVKERDTQWDNV